MTGEKSSSFSSQRKQRRVFPASREKTTRSRVCAFLSRDYFCGPHQARTVHYWRFYLRFVLSRERAFPPPPSPFTFHRNQRNPMRRGHRDFPRFSHEKIHTRAQSRYSVTSLLINKHDAREHAPSNETIGDNDADVTCCKVGRTTVLQSLSNWADARVSESVQRVNCYMLPENEITCLFQQSGYNPICVIHMQRNQL